MPLGDAAEQALALDAATDLAALLEALLRAGAFTTTDPSTESIP